MLDWSYWKPDDWGSQEFDSSRFADAAGMIKTLHDQYKTRFMISVWPKFYEGLPIYETFQQKRLVVQSNIAGAAARLWIGKGYTSTFYDALNRKARVAFWNLHQR